MGTAQGALEQLRGPTTSLRAASSGVWAGFASMQDAAMADGALARKTKELIALAIAVTKECDGCIVSHAKGAARYALRPKKWPKRFP